MTAPGLAVIRNGLLGARKAAIADYTVQRQPSFLLRRLSRACEVALQELAAHIGLPEGAALAATGGFGRQEMYPHSDVDVLVLLAREPDADDVQALERLIAAMWDVGLDVAHSVRTFSQCLEAAASDITIQTSLLEARWLAGAKPEVQQLLDALRAQLDPQEFFKGKRAEMRRRHAHFHDTPYALEPNCKESPGALRDLQLLLWLAHAAGYGKTWRDAVRNGLISAAQCQALHRAERAFRRLRVELHLLTGRREDRVLFDLQPELARIYGFRAAAPRTASELLMQRYFWAARVVTQLTIMVMPALEEQLFAPCGAILALDDDFGIRDGRLELLRDDAFERNTALIFKAFQIVQEMPALNGMSARTLRALWHARLHIDAQFRANPVNQDVFLRLLKHPSGVDRTLEAMTTLNILPRYIPPFRRVVGQMQHDLFHAYTVDEHTLKVVQNIARFTLVEHAHEYPQASQLMADLDESHLLYIAALFHDIAKGRGGNHSEAGAVDAETFCRRHRLDGDDTAFVTFLVRHHLLMSTVAQKRDLSDPAVIQEFSAMVGSRRRLDALYVLTVADIRATNPTLWNSWKGKLLDDLYQRARMVLGGERADTGAVLAQRKRVAAAQAAAMGVSDAQRHALWDVLDVAWFLRHEADDIAWHTAQVAPRLNRPETLVRARTLGHNEALQVMVWAPDRKDLFADICHYFEQLTLGVQDARIHTTRHGWALDSFVVLSGQPHAHYDDWIGTVQRDLALYLDDPGHRHQTVGIARRHPPESRRRARLFPVAPTVDLRRDGGSSLWRLSVTCADRPGLLSDLAQVFTRHDVDLRMAKIHTLGPRAEDVFILESDALAQGRQRLHFERDALAALSGP